MAGRAHCARRERHGADCFQDGRGRGQSGPGLGVDDHGVVDGHHQRPIDDHHLHVIDDNHRPVIVDGHHHRPIDNDNHGPVDDHDAHGHDDHDHQYQCDTPSRPPTHGLPGPGPPAVVEFDRDAGVIGSWLNHVRCDV
ncbi:MAG: hypothetical protein ACXVJ3_17085, partial [Ilumatobacteraceae bacterium]